MTFWRSTPKHLQTKKKHFKHPFLDQRWCTSLGLTMALRGFLEGPVDLETKIYVQGNTLCIMYSTKTSMRRKWEINVSSSAQDSNIKFNCTSLNPVEQDGIKKILIPVQKSRMFIIRSIKLILFGECISQRNHPVGVLNYIQRFCKKLSPRNKDIRWR